MGKVMVMRIELGGLEITEEAARYLGWKPEGQGAGGKLLSAIRDEIAVALRAHFDEIVKSAHRSYEAERDSAKRREMMDEFCRLAEMMEAAGIDIKEVVSKAKRDQLEIEGVAV